MMLMPDVNVLIYAFDRTAPGHSAYRAWLQDLINSNQTFAMSSLVLSGFIRIVTHPRILNIPATLDIALSFTERILSSPFCIIVSPGPRHWGLFTQLCREGNARGSLVTDAYLAALAIETGCEWITTDRDFSRFPGLKWRHPLD